MHSYSQADRMIPMSNCGASNILRQQLLRKNHPRIQENEKVLTMIWKSRKEEPQKILTLDLDQRIEIRVAQERTTTLMRMSSLMAVTISLRITITQIPQAVQVAQIIQRGAICGQDNKQLWVASEQEQVVAIIITMKKMKMMKAGVMKWKK